MSNLVYIRRKFLRDASLGSAGLVVAGQLIGDDRIITPSQTEGPFYPVPEISKQPHYDADLTRTSEDGPLADGELIVVKGQVIDVRGEPLKGTWVEIWQANASGRYNHPRDDNPAPLDPNFQYFARIETDEEGRYTFKTIRPGKYPGRTPHIHFRIDAPKKDRLTTQMYFEQHGRDNDGDGIYRALTKQEKEAVTVAFAKSDEDDGLPVGEFIVVVGKHGERGTTPPM